MTPKFLLRTTGLLAFSIMTGLMFASLGDHGSRSDVSNASPTGIAPAQHGLYALLDQDQMIDSTDVIFIGKVVNISSTQWNQDSGEPWHDKATGFGLQLHHLEFEVIQTVVDAIGISKHVTLTVLGQSPLDGYADHNLRIGDRTIIFAVQRELAWRGGTKTILRLTNAPTASYFVAKEDGLYYNAYDGTALSLKAIVTHIAQRRATLIEP